MSDLPNTPGGKKDGPSYTPASPTRRIIAWVGVIYMVIIVALTTYAIATGELLGGLTGLMVAPALGGLAAVTWVRWQGGDYRGGTASALQIVAAAAAACAVNLFWGVLSLVLQFGG